MNNTHIAVTPSVPRICIYCGDVARKVKKGEHIVPRAIGGVRAIKNVCNTCNNGVLSDLDRELSTASPLALIASEVFQSGVGLAWDVDHHDGNMLMEASPQWSEQSMLLWPQLIVTHRGCQIRADLDELQRFGAERFMRVFIRQIRKNFARWQYTGKGLFFEPLHACQEILASYQYPPRLFARVRLDQLDRQETFIVGYNSNADKRHLLHALDNWDAGNQFNRFAEEKGSSLPVVRRYWDPFKILRSLTKLGINLLCDCCENTPVDSVHFRDAIRFVLGDTGPTPALLRTSGFVCPSDLADLHRHDDGHAFRLTHSGNRWHLLCSFFGGRVCASIQFPGPSMESWKTCEVSTPIASDRDVSSEWEIRRHSLIIPTNYRVEWNDPTRIVPSANLVNTRGVIDIRDRPKKTKMKMVT